MYVVSALIAYLEAPEAVHPRKRTLYRPSVSAQLLTGVDAPTSDARGYAPLPQGLATSREVVGLVSMELVGALPRSTTTRLADR